MVDDVKLLRVFRQILIDIECADFARLELVVVNRQPMYAATEPQRNRLISYARVLSNPEQRRRILFTLYRKFDQRHIVHPDPLEEIDCGDILDGIPRLEVDPITKRFVHRFPPEAVTALRDYDLDVLVRFGFNILRGDVLTAARYGIWSFHHGDNEYIRGGPALFWEVVEDHPCSGVMLQVLNEQIDNGLVLCKALFPTVRGVSRTRNGHAPYWGSTHFVIRKLNELHEQGWDSLVQHAVPPVPYRGKTAVYKMPTNSHMVKWTASTAVRLAPRIFRRPFVMHWRICLRRAAGPGLLSGSSAERSEYRWVPCPPGHFYADPFLLRHQGQIWMFFEDGSYANMRGSIACAPVQPDLSVGPVVTCLNAPYHMSYPFVFHNGSDIFMIPETLENESVDLYRATDFPYSWKLEKTLFRGPFVDTTPVQHDGRWYFFTTICEPSTVCVFGALFSSNELDGDWVHHPASPISMDVHYARSAGPIQNVAGRLLRPVQDCSESYGRRIRVQEVQELTPSSYREQSIGTIEPDWEPDLKGTHTYGVCDGIEVLDALNFPTRKQVFGQG